MASGKHSANQNARLRQELADERSRADRAERELATTIDALDRCQAELADMRAQGVPGLEAERARADAAIRQRDDAVRLRDEHWRSLLDDVRSTVAGALKNFSDDHRPALTGVAVTAGTELWGDDWGNWIGDNRQFRRRFNHVNQERAARLDWEGRRETGKDRGLAAVEAARRRRTEEGLEQKTPSTTTSAAALTSDDGRTHTSDD